MPQYLADTNVCLRLANTQAPEHASLRGLVRALVTQGDEVVIVPQAVYELWTVATRPAERNGLGWSPAHTRAAVELLLANFALLEDTPAVFTNWLALVTRYGVSGKQVHDARLVAAMLAHNLTHLLTLNVADFARYTEITPVHPSAVPPAPGEGG